MRNDKKAQSSKKHNDLLAFFVRPIAISTVLGMFSITGLSGGTFISEAAAKTTSAAVTSAAKTTSQKYKDGTYTGIGTGFMGGITKINVTISKGKITNIKTISNQDTASFFSKVYNTMVKKIISSQSVKVDTITGATFSSKGIISAVTNALTKAQAKAVTSTASAAKSSTTTKSTITTTSSKAKLKDGVFTGSGTGFRGGSTTVSVHIKSGKISAIDTVSTDDTPRFYGRCETSVIEQILSAQSASVDTVSGATYSSNGIIEAVGNALAKATNK